MHKFYNVIFWYCTQLLRNCSCNAVPTLRLFGIIVAKKYATFSLIKRKQGGQLRLCFFGLSAAPPVYAHESFSPPFGPARFGALQRVVLGVQWCSRTLRMGRVVGGGWGGAVERTRRAPNCTMNADLQKVPGSSFGEGRLPSGGV